MDFNTDILPLKDKLFRMALRITMQREEAEDIVQEALIKLWKQRDKLADIDNLEAYAITVCRNLAVDKSRRTAVMFASIDGEQQTMPTPSVNPYDSIYASESLRQITDLMAQLPEKQRLCMHLRDFEGMNYRDIATALEITEDQVKVNIFRARKFIKEKMVIN